MSGGSREGRLTRREDPVRDPAAEHGAGAQLYCEHSPLPMWVYDTETLRLLDVNRAAMAEYGYSRDEFLQLTIRDLQPPEDVPLLQQRLRIVTSDAEIRPGFGRHRRRNGSTTLVRVASRAMELQGRPARLVVVEEIPFASAAEPVLEREPPFVSAVLDTIGALVAVFDREGRLTQFNRACEITTGYSAAEVCGRPFWDRLLLSEEVETVRAVFADLLAGQTPGTVEHHWVTKQGTCRLLTWATTLLRDAEGEPEHIVAMGIDVTERRRAERALRESREQYRFFIQQTTEGVWCAEVNPPLPVNAPEQVQLEHCANHAYLVEVNDAMVRMYGCRDASEHIGARLGSTFDMADPSTQEFFRGFIRGGYRTGDLESREFDLHGRPHRFVNHMVGVVEEGQLTRIWGTQHDVTERQEAEEAVRAARDHLRALVDASPLAIVGVDSAGVVLSWNRSAENTFGWTADEAIGHRLINIPPDKQGEFDELLARVLSEHPFTNYETQRLRKDGTRIDVSISTAALHDARGRPIGSVAIHLDITERKRAEEQLQLSQEQVRQAQKMEAVGRLAGGIAHDFNNLLTAILSYSELALTDLRPEDPIREDIQQIREAGGRAAELTKQLLAFSRRQLLQFSTLSLNDVVIQAEPMLQPLMGDDVEIRLALSPTLGHTRADAGQLEQVLLNLAVNARDAMPSGGALTLTTAAVEVDADAPARWGHLVPGSYVTLAVQDTGTGMSPEVQERIFEPFFTTKGLGQGTGLGLSTVHGIVNQSGGHIIVASETGGGSTFTIFLPASAPAPEPARAESPAAPAVQGASETVLLVEDEDLVRQLAREILLRNGYRVLEAADGAEALRVVTQYEGEIDLMVTDVVMPRMSGNELVGHARPLRPAMRVLYVSGYSEEAIARHGKLTEGVELLPKPYTPSVLTAKIRQILDRTS
jgi:two-component system, cell cycle sensor histidine kinase and response regulator CckA